MDQPDRITVRPARKERLADAIYGQVLELIVTGQYQEGDKLPSEPELASAFDVSRPVVREALGHLQSDGLVQVRKGVGTFVSRMPSKRITEVANASEIAGFLRSLEPRIVLEVEAARLAATRRTRAQLGDIKAANEALKTRLGAGELGMEEDLAFHDAISEASGNEFFRHLLNEIRKPIVGTVALGLELARDRSSALRTRVVEEHDWIINAITSQDSEGAATYMRYHLFQARSGLVDVHHLNREN